MLFHNDADDRFLENHVHTRIFILLSSNQNDAGQYGSKIKRPFIMPHLIFESGLTMFHSKFYSYCDNSSHRHSFLQDPVFVLERLNKITMAKKLILLKYKSTTEIPK